MHTCILNIPKRAGACNIYISYFLTFSFFSLFNSPLITPRFFPKTFSLVHWVNQGLPLATSQVTSFTKLGAATISIFMYLCALGNFSWRGRVSYSHGMVPDWLLEEWIRQMDAKLCKRLTYEPYLGFSYIYHCHIIVNYNSSLVIFFIANVLPTSIELEEWQYNSISTTRNRWEIWN